MFWRLKRAWMKVLWKVRACNIISTNNEELRSTSKFFKSCQRVFWGPAAPRVCCVVNRLTTSHNRRLVALSLTSTNNSTKCFSEYKCTDSLKHFYFHIYVIKGNLRYGSRVTFCLPAAPRTEKVFRFKLVLTGPPAQKEQKALAWSNAAREKRTKHVVLSFIQIPVLQKQKAQPEKRGQAP